MVKPDAGVQGICLGAERWKVGRCNALLRLQTHCMCYSQFENSVKVQAISLAQAVDVGLLGSVGASPKFESFDTVGWYAGWCVFENQKFLACVVPW